MKRTQTLFLLASEGGYRLLRTADEALSEIAAVNSDSFADMPESDPGSQRNAFGPSGAMFGTGEESRLGELARAAVARHAMTALDQAWAKQGCDRIAIAAGPKMLGALRAALPKALTDKVALELAKDLMAVRVHDLPPHFEGKLGW
jgi:protein required for attachment to host cells